MVHLDCLCLDYKSAQDLAPEYLFPGHLALQGVHLEGETEAMWAMDDPE